MSFLRMRSRLPVKSAATFGIIATCGLVLAGCGGSLGRMPLVGEPSYIPAAPETPPAYPSVGESKIQRTSKPMTAAERAKVEADIAKARAGAAAERRRRIQEPTPQE